MRSDSRRRWKLAIAASVLMFVAGHGFCGNDLPSAQPHILAAVQATEQRTGAFDAAGAGARRRQHAAAARRRGARGNRRACSIPAFTTAWRSIASSQNQNIATVATLYGQHPTSPVTLEVMIDGDQLEAGSYFLRVRKQASDEEPLDFPFARD